MKIFKWLLYIIIALAILGAAAIWFFSEEKPAIQEGSGGDHLANKMLKALNHAAFENTKYIRWSFAGKNHYFYDQSADKAEVAWDNKRVLLNLDDQSGEVFQDNISLEGKEKDELLKKAWSNWCNDSFWMLAPFKVFDPGTKRSVALDDNGKEALMVEYTSGGVTPGDSYLWILDDNYVPTGYKMWTQILPIQGMYASWENWEEHQGAKYSTLHNMKFKLKMENFLASNDLADFGFDKNPFE